VPAKARKGGGSRDVRILLVNDYAEPFGGAERHVSELQTLLAGRGHETELLAGGGASPLTLLTRWFSPWAYRRTRRAIAEFRPDVLHLHGCSRVLSPSPAIAAKRAAVPVIMTVHDAHLVCPKTWMIYADGEPCQLGFGRKCLTSNCVTWRRGYRNAPYHFVKWGKVAFHRWLLTRSVERFISPSAWLADWLARSLAPGRVSHVPQFAPAPPRHVGEGSERNLRLLYVGRLSSEKGVDTLLRALPLVLQSFPDLGLDVLGSGSEEGALRGLARDLGLGDRVSFQGAVAPSQLEGYYRTALAVVIPSRWMENAPLVAYEAMGYGVPIIASARGGLVEVVESERNGLLFRADVHADLAEAILRLSRDEELRERLGSGARRLAEERYSGEAHLRQLEETYRAAAAGGAGTGKRPPAP
jgi:glycosyltransferase involved in cell wall biosynthesis